MINLLIEAISNKILSLFENVVIYTDKVPQNFITPSVYFPTENSLTAQEEINNVLAILAENLHFINTGNQVIKAYDVESNRDEELHYIVTYKFIALKDNENVNMEVLNERTGVNG